MRENDRVFLANARSKSGFLIAATDKAKRGELDVRGFGAIDPWKATMEALKCTTYSWKKYGDVSLQDEEEWLGDAAAQAPGGIRNLAVDVTAVPDLGIPQV